MGLIPNISEESCIGACDHSCISKNGSGSDRSGDCSDHDVKPETRIERSSAPKDVKLPLFLPELSDTDSAGKHDHPIVVQGSDSESRGTDPEVRHTLTLSYVDVLMHLNTACSHVRNVEENIQTRGSEPPGEPN